MLRSDPRAPYRVCEKRCQTVSLPFYRFPETKAINLGDPFLMDTHSTTFGAHDSHGVNFAVSIFGGLELYGVYQIGF
jgi:hypothetical protein